MVFSPLRWKLALCGMVLVAPALSIAQAPAGLEGDWQGTLKSGQSALRLVLHIARASDGRYFGQMDSVDLGSTTLIDSIQLTGDSVRLELKAIKGTFEGSINAARNTLTGTWNQGAAVPIEFKRAVAVSEAPKPLPRYQPPPTATPPAAASSAAPASGPALAPDNEKKLADQRAATLARNKALQDAFNAGLAALAAKNFPVAIQKLEEGSQLDASQSVVWANLGDAYVGRSSVETGADRDATLRGAVSAYQKAINLKPNEAAFHNNYGLALAKSSKFPEAEAEFAKAAQIDPAKAGQYYFNLGAVLVNRGQEDPAVSAFRKAIEADPTYSDAYYQLGECLFAKRANAGTWPDGTQQAFQKYIELKPDGPNAAEARAKLQQMSQPVTAGVKVVGTPVMAKTGSCSSDAPAGVDRFLSTDSIMLWFGLEGLSDDDAISIRYTEPSGAISRDQGRTFKPTSRSHFLCLSLKNPATMAPGKWSAGVYLNDASTPLFAPVTFTMTRVETQGVTVVGTPVMTRIAIDPCPLDAPAAATQFLSTDRTLAMWFKLAGLSGEDTISIRHTEPSGEVSRVYGFTFKPTAGSRPFCVTKTNVATMPPGTWSVAAYLNNSTTPLFPPLVFTLKRATVRPPAPLAEDANLEATMRFIEDGLNAKGRVEFRDPPPGMNPADSALFADEVTGAAADPRRCELSFHLLFGSTGANDTLTRFRFADVDNLSVIPRHAQPPVFMLQMHTKTEAVVEHHVATLRKDPATNLFLATPSAAAPRPDRQSVAATVYFSDEAAAQSMAVAMVHAVELCGGGSQDQ